MKHTRLLILFAIISIIILLISLLFSNNVSAFVYEYNDSATDGVAQIFTTRWFAQTFTVGTVGLDYPYTITNVSLKLYRQGTVSKVYVYLRDTTGELPSGGDLAYAERNGAEIGTSSTGYFIMFNFTVPYTVTPGHKYAIVINSTGSSSSIDVKWLYKASASTYAGGRYCSSTDSGVTWSSLSTVDFMFYVYGTNPLFNITIDNVSPANNTDATKTYNFSSLKIDYSKGISQYFNLTFNKTCLQGWNSTTSIYLNGTTLVGSHTWINGSHTFNIFDYYTGNLHNNTTYSWKIVNHWNIFYVNFTYYFTFKINFTNLPISSCGNTSLTIIGHHVNTTHTNESYYDFDTGWTVYDNDTGNATIIYMCINLNTSEKFTTLTDAIDDADTLNGHTIYIYPGNWSLPDTPNIDKELTIEGQSKYCPILYGRTGFYGFTTQANNITIRKLRLENSNGILIYNSNNINVNNISIDNTTYGIGTYNGKNVTISDSFVTKSTYGSYNYGTENLTINRFEADDCTIGIFTGALTSRHSKNILIQNSYIHNSTNENIYLNSYTDNITIKSNVISGSPIGIYVSGHVDVAYIYNNYIIDNTINAKEYLSPTNIFFNITKISETNIIDKNYLGGNYWDDYNGHDFDGDYLGDSSLPYTSNGNITSGGDYHPLLYSSHLITLYENTLRVLGTHEYNFGPTGFNVWANYSTSCVIFPTIINATGSSPYVWDSILGRYEVYPTYTGTTTPIHLVDNTFNVLKEFEYLLNGTGYYVFDNDTTAIWIHDTLNYANHSYYSNFDDGTGYWDVYYSGDTENNLFENIINASGTHETSWTTIADSRTAKHYGVLEGYYNTWANYTGDTTPINLLEHITNATGTHNYILNSTGYWVTANYTGNETGGTTPIHLFDNFINASGTHVYILNLTGYYVWANVTGDTTPIHTSDIEKNVTGTLNYLLNGTGYWVTSEHESKLHQVMNLVNASGTHQKQWNGTTWNDWANITGTTTPFHHFTNYSLNVTGTHIYKLNATGYWDWANATGTGNVTIFGFNLTGVTIEQAQFGMLVLLVLSIFFLFMGYAMNDRKQGGWFLIFGSFFVISLFTGILGMFMGVWLFISPAICLFFLYVMYSGITMIRTGKPYRRN